MSSLNLNSAKSISSRRLANRATQSRELVRLGGIAKSSNCHFPRLRSGRPERTYSWEKLVEESLQNHGSDSDHDSNSSRSDSDSCSDTEEDEIDGETIDDSVWLNYQSIRTRLIPTIYPQVRAWTQQARYVAPPDDRLPPRTRYRSDSDRPGPKIFYQQFEDPKDPNTILVMKADGYFHLACPFYISNPARHEKCLLEHDLQSIEDVIRHVSQCHTEPPYCPRCRQTFSRAIDRDRHFLERTCDIQTEIQVEGVNSYQKTRLLKKDKIILGEKERWHRIWHVAIPNTQAPSRSYYLSGEDEVKVSITRDYWAQNGKQMVSEFLVQDGYSSSLTDLTLNVICRWALEDILHQLREVNVSATRTS